MHETASVGQESESAEGRIWFLPSGAARGARNAHRVRGWIIAIGAALVLWGLIAAAVVAIVSAVD